MNSQENSYGSIPLGGSSRIATVARELGVSRSWASREAHRPGTRAMIQALRLPEGQQVDALLSEFNLQLAARERRRLEAQLRERGQV